MVRDPGIPGASVSAIWNKPMWPTCDWVSPEHYVYWDVNSLNEIVRLLGDTPARVFVLDVMYAKEQGFWTTWFFHKQPDTVYLEHVDINIRIFDATPYVTMPIMFDTLEPHQIDGRWPGERLFRGFLGVLAAIFYLGPGFRDKRAPQMPQMGVFVINQLTLSFKDSGPFDQPHPDLLISKGYHNVGVMPDDNRSDKSPHARLCDLLRGLLESVLSLRRGDEGVPVGQMLYENVMSTIKFEVGGSEEVAVFDVEKLFNDLYASKTERVDGFDEWKARTALRRAMLKDGMAPGQD